MTSEPAPPGATHRLHDEAVEQLLASGERRRELVALLGEQAYRELSALARRARETALVRLGLYFTLMGGWRERPTE